MSDPAPYLVKKAESGDKEAQYELGLNYSVGDFDNDGSRPPVDHVKAVYWFRKAAEQGHVDAQLNLAYAYKHGEGVARDPIEACAWAILGCPYPVPYEVIRDTRFPIDIHLSMYGSSEKRHLIEGSLTPQDRVRAQNRAREIQEKINGL